MGDKSKQKKKEVIGKEKIPQPQPNGVALAPPVDANVKRIGKDCDYEKELSRLQVELVKLQEWVKLEHLKVVVLFEGRDAAGKG